MGEDASTRKREKKRRGAPQVGLSDRSRPRYRHRPFRGGPEGGPVSLRAGGQPLPTGRSGN
eukprot:13910075-Alexandrium_andersonii.AAC.1